MQHTSGEAVVVVELCCQATAEECEVETEVEYAGLLPCQVFVQHFLIDEAWGYLTVVHIVILTHDDALLVGSNATVVTQLSIGHAYLGIGEAYLLCQGLYPWLFGYSPSQRTRGEETVAVAIEELRTAVNTEIEFQQITVVGIVVDTAYP